MKRPDDLTLLDMNLKIEMIVPALPPAGMEVMVAGLTRGLGKRGYDVGVTCLHYRGSLGDALEADGYRVTVAPTPGLRTIILPSNLVRWLNQRRPDVAHIHTGVWLKAARAARIARVPRVVHTMHGLDGIRPWYERFLEYWALRNSQAAVAVSPVLTAYLTRTLRVDPHRVHVVPNGIDTERFRPGARSGRVRSRLSMGENDVLIGHVARFSPVKNHSLLLAAFAEVTQVRPQALLVLIGDGPLRAEMETRAAELGIEDRVAFLGRLDDMPDVYRELDVLVLPSRSEGTSLSILEGMASGLPIVATAVGGTPELLEHGRCGVLVPADDPVSLSDALIRLIDRPAERARLGQTARGHCLEKYTEARMIDAYEAIYTGLSTGRNGRHV